ncbi:helix-turn-helix domain-containing protein [Peijinzhouia sedimentorum]
MKANQLIFSTFTPEEIKGMIDSAVKDAITLMPNNASLEPETILSRKEAAEILKISLVSLNDWTRRGLLQSYSIGGRVYYKAKELEASLHKTKTVKY